MTSTALTLEMVLPPSIAGVTDAELDVIRSLVATWHKKYRRNVLRSTYYDAKMPLKPTGNIPPEAYARIRAVVGWPAKSVTALAQRTVFDGFVAPGQASDPFGFGPLRSEERRVGRAGRAVCWSCCTY